MNNLLPSLREDVRRAQERLGRQKVDDRDNVLAIAMYEADLLRAKRELERHMQKTAPVRWPMVEEKRAA